MLIEYIRVINWQSKKLPITNTTTPSLLPRIGKGNWVHWLIAEGYELIDHVELGIVTIDLYMVEDGNLYYVYCSDFAGLDSERILINIPTEQEARCLINMIKQQLEPLVVRGCYF
jgi:hypothetical protein